MYGTLTGSRVVACRHYRVSCFIQFRTHINGRTVHNIIRATVDDNSFNIGKFLKLAGCDIVGINLTVHPHLPDVPGQFCVLCASQVKNYNHILFHLLPPEFIRILLLLLKCLS